MSQEDPPFVVQFYCLLHWSKLSAKLALSSSLLFSFSSRSQFFFQTDLPVELPWREKSRWINWCRYHALINVQQGEIWVEAVLAAKCIPVNKLLVLYRLFMREERRKERRDGGSSSRLLLWEYLRAPKGSGSILLANLCLVSSFLYYQHASSYFSAAFFLETLDCVKWLQPARETTRKWKKTTKN